MHEVLKTIGDLGIVPVVTIEDAADAVPVCRALAAGGLPVAEFTFRTGAAEQAIRNVTAEMPEVLVGAGTVLTTEQADRAIKSGARFIVSPGIDPAVVRFCLEKGVPITPGCATPTEVGVAVSLGLEVAKFFPAEAFGGLKTLKAIGAPFGSVKFIPTSGIDASNLNEYLAFGKVLACGGSWMVKPELIKAKDFAGIDKLTREAITAMLGFDLAHVGVNTADAAASVKIAKTLAGIFDMPIKEGEGSNWVGAGFEIMKWAGRGTHGHIAVGTNSLPRAVAYLERKGTAIDHESAYAPGGGPIVSIFLADEIGGFAIHLLQRA